MPIAWISAAVAVAAFLLIAVIALAAYRLRGGAHPQPACLQRFSKQPLRAAQTRSTLPIKCEVRCPSRLSPITPRI
jgi:hypothetical protein